MENLLSNIIIPGMIYDALKITGKFAFISSLNKLFKIERPDVFDNMIDEIEVQKDSIRTADDIARIIDENENYKKIVSNLKYKTGFSERINKGMAYINAAVKPKNSLNAESLGRILGIESAQDLIRYVNGDKIPSFETEELIAKAIGLNPLWMKEGNGLCQYIIDSTSNIYSVKQKIMELKPKKIWLVYDQTEKDVSFVFQFNEYAYRYVNYTLAFREQIGATGESELEEFYDLLAWLQREHAETALSGELHIIDYNLKYAVTHEKKHVALALTESNDIYTNFVDDFLDCNCNEHIKECFRGQYGEEFVHLQKIVALRKQKNVGCLHFENMYDI